MRRDLAEALGGAREIGACREREQPTRREFVWPGAGFLMENPEERAAARGEKEGARGECTRARRGMATRVVETRAYVERKREREREREREARGRKRARTQPLAFCSGVLCEIALVGRRCPRGEIDR